MRIAVDVSPLQGPHRYRGIGYTIINFINNISAEAKKKHQFVFLSQPQNYTMQESFLDLLDLKDMDYQVLELPEKKKFTFQLPGKLKYLRSVLNQLSDLFSLYFGDVRFNNIGRVDIFLQMAPDVGLPKIRKVKKVLIIYDIIPYVLESDYLWSYATARNHGFSRLAALRCAARRLMYRYRIKAVCAKADILLAISEKTKDDFIKILSISPKKIFVTPLGIESLRDQEEISRPAYRYINTGWGYYKRNYEFNLDIPYLLFVGGADPRRKIDDLVAAFNRLRAEGIEIKLVLAGNIIRGSEAIPVKASQFALRNSSYAEDIIYLGFVSDSEREWLYRHALAFVYPSMYEGFGLPILEAMQHGTPVITYKNSSIPEAAGNAALYANSYQEIYRYTKELLADKSLAKKYGKLGVAQAQRFNWAKTADSIIDVVSS